MRYRKLLLLLSPGLFFFGVCGWNVWGSYDKILQAQEAQAAVTVPVAKFPESYQPGQRWLAVEGKLAMDQHVQEDATAARNPKRKLVAIIAPLVPPDWRPADLVHVFVHCATVEPHEVNAKLADLRQEPLTLVSSEPQPVKIESFRAAFPELKPVEPLVLVRYGTEKPDVTTTVAWFLVLMTVFLVWLVYLVRQLRREFARGDEQGGQSGQ